MCMSAIKAVGWILFICAIALVRRGPGLHEPDTGPQLVRQERALPASNGILPASLEHPHAPVLAAPRTSARAEVTIR